jgi:hypothetical protein
MRDPYHGTDGGLGRTSNNRHAQGTTSDRRFYSSTGFWSGMPASSSCMEPRHHQSLSATRLEPQAENAAGGPGTGLPFHLDTTVIEVRRPMRHVIPQDGMLGQEPSEMTPNLAQRYGVGRNTQIAAGSPPCARTAK